MAALASSGMHFAAMDRCPRINCQSLHSPASHVGQPFKGPGGIACRRPHNSRQRPFTAVGRGKPVRCVAAGGSPLKVAVTGAGGRTGSLTVKWLLREPDRYSVVAIVRRPEVDIQTCSHAPCTGHRLQWATACDERSQSQCYWLCHAQSAAERLGDLPDGALTVVDIAAEGAAEDLAKAFDGAGALVIASSAVRKRVKQHHLFAQNRQHIRNNTQRIGPEPFTWRLSMGPH